jgi:hypothetical protein
MRILITGGFEDMRRRVPSPEKIYRWISYRLRTALSEPREGRHAPAEVPCLNARARLVRVSAE